MATQVEALVSGNSDPRFRSVEEEFRKNFTDRGEVGAALAIYVDGKLVVDLWGGKLAIGSSEDWSRDTLI